VGDAVNHAAIEQMLALDDEAWTNLTGVLDAHPDVNLHAPGSPPRNSRDVYAHLARWMEYSTAALKAVLAGKPAPELEGTPDETNDRWHAKDVALSLDEARQWAAHAYEERRRAIRAVPLARWGGEVEKYARFDGAQHIGHHLGYLDLAHATPYPAASVEPARAPARGKYEIVVEKHFDCAHYLRGYQGKCEALHGHRYTVRVRLTATRLNEIGLAYDFGDVKLHLNRIMDRYDHTCLNDVPPFDAINPSAENIAATIYAEMADKLAAEPVRLTAVEAWETPQQGVVFTPD
jgi:6-pyruvoyltetrahydropterin/6-carboxytetrahydropterin synthase